MMYCTFGIAVRVLKLFKISSMRRHDGENPGAGAAARVAKANVRYLNIPQPIPVLPIPLLTNLSDLTILLSWHSDHIRP